MPMIDRPAILARMERLGITTADLQRITGRHYSALHRSLRQGPTRIERQLAEIVEALDRWEAEKAKETAT